MALASTSASHGGNADQSIRLGYGRNSEALSSHSLRRSGYSRGRACSPQHRDPSSDLLVKRTGQAAPLLALRDESPERGRFAPRQTLALAVPPRHPSDDGRRPKAPAADIADQQSGPPYARPSSVCTSTKQQRESACHRCPCQCFCASSRFATFGHARRNARVGYSVVRITRTTAHMASLARPSKTCAVAAQPLAPTADRLDTELELQALSQALRSIRSTGAT